MNPYLSLLLLLLLVPYHEQNESSSHPLTNVCKICLNRPLSGNIKKLVWMLNRYVMKI
jgi:hypothetical protein